MDLEKLQSLKDMVMTAKDLADPWNYFFDHFSDSPSFMSQGKTVKNAPKLAGIIEGVGSQLLSRKARVKALRLTSLREHSFVHGACQISKRLTTVIYFTDVKMGLLAVQDPSGQTFFIRFTEMGVAPASDEDSQLLSTVPPTRDIVN